MDSRFYLVSSHWTWKWWKCVGCSFRWEILWCLLLFLHCQRRCKLLNRRCCRKTQRSPELFSTIEIQQGIGNRCRLSSDIGLAFIHSETIFSCYTLWVCSTFRVFLQALKIYRFSLHIFLQNLKALRFFLRIIFRTLMIFSFSLIFLFQLIQLFSLF